MNKQLAVEISIDPSFQNIADEVSTFMSRNGRKVTSVCPTNKEHTKYLIVYTEPK
jgi:hypothetical protein